MIVAQTQDELRNAIGRGTSVGFIPTMGALHEGHLALMRASVDLGLHTAVSIFVNPTQFGPSDDLSKYPRPIEADLEKCASIGVRTVFRPTVETIYGNSNTVIEVGEVAHRWEGEFRPGHFTGVATVVAKLFGLVGPCDAFFGLKDLQQCAVIRQLVHDLFLPVQLQFVETIRAADGLALSSRNAYFTPEQRADVAELPQVLRDTCVQIGASVEPDVESIIQQGRNTLTKSGWLVDYLACVDALTMKPASVPSDTTRCIVAARKHGVRLIDNMPIIS